MKSKAVFLDRDGVINKVVYHQDIGLLDSPFTLKQFQLLPRAAKAVKLINRMKFKVVLVSNQPGIAKGHFDLNTLGKMEKRMKRDLAKEDAQLDKTYYCFHHPTEGKGKYKRACNCRKPKPGLILKASKEMSVDLKRSYMVGDSITDIEAGKKAGCKTILIGNHKCDLCRLLTKHKVKPDYIASDLYNAVRLIKTRFAKSKKDTGGDTVRQAHRPEQSRRKRLPYKEKALADVGATLVVARRG